MAGFTQGKIAGLDDAAEGRTAGFTQGQIGALSTKLSNGRFYVIKIYKDNNTQGKIAGLDDAAAAGFTQGQIGALSTASGRFYSRQNSRT